jgi:hypothetical protein
MNTKNYYVVKDTEGKILSINTNLDKAWESIAKTGGFITPKTIDDKEVKEFLENEETKEIQTERKEKDDYVYILITNYNTIDFQSFVVKYESWEKFKNNFINSNEHKEKIFGTLQGYFRFNDFEVDWHDDFHMRLTSNKRKTYGEKSCAYLISKNDMKNFIESELIYE